MMEQLHLFATVAGTRIAVCAEEVEAVVRLNELSPVPGMPSHIAGLSALRRRVLTVIDMAALVLGAPTPSDARSLAVVADIAGHSYGMMVDTVSDICEAAGGRLPLRGQLDPAWSRFAEGVIENEGDPHLLVSLSRFVELPTVAMAA